MFRDSTLTDIVLDTIRERPPEHTKLLLIDDNEDVPQVIRGMLSDLGYSSFDLLYADRLSSGLELLTVGDIHLVLLDLSLPDSDGLDTLLKVRTHAPGVPIVVLTGLNDEMSQLEAVQGGAQDYLVKGEFSSKLLGRSLRYAIERHRLMAEQRLQEAQASEARLRDIIEKNADAIVIVDQGGAVCFANSAAESLFGRPREAFLGDKFRYPLGPGEVSEIDLSSTNGKTTVAEMQVVETEWEGKPAYLASLRDITGRKKAEEELKIRYRQLQTLLEISQVILNSRDIQSIMEEILDKAVSAGSFHLGIVRHFNPHTGTLIPVAWLGYRDPRNVERHHQRISDARSGRLTGRVLTLKGVHIEEDVQGCEGLRTLKREEVHSAMVIPMCAEEEILGVLLLASRTPRKFAPNEVSLFEAIGMQAGIAVQKSRLFEDVTNQKEELQKANKVKDEFMSVMSHELRTPLNVVLGYTGLIKDGVMGEVNLKQEEALGKILLQAKDQLDMVNNILYATALEAHRVTVEKEVVLPERLFKELKLTYDQVQLGKELSLVWECPAGLPALKTDSLKLKHVLENIINNAIKFTEEGTVTIAAQFVCKARAVVFKVSDTGIGIPSDKLSTIFDKFFLGDSSDTRQYGGVGIGLYVAKKYAELLGGQVRVETRVGKGSTFTLTIPLE